MPTKRQVISAKTLDKRGRLISQAQNSYTKTHSLQKHIAELVGTPEKEYLHAEILSLLRSRGRQVDSVVVERFDSEGNPALAKPCKVCQKALEMFGAKWVKYTDPSSDTGYTKERI